MPDLQNIIDYCSTESASEMKLALATVVSVSGSAYRRPGARMLILESGRTIGTISGGCLEADVALRARHCIETGESILLHYSTSSSSDDVIFGVGQGCNGSLQILVNRLEPTEATNSIRLIAEALAAREAVVLVTVYGKGGDAHVEDSVHAFHRDGFTVGENCADGIVDLLTADAQKAFATEKSFCAAYSLEGKEMHALIEYVQPPVHLVICGAGFDALPVISLAKQIGWRVTVIDARQSYLAGEQLKLADALICCQPADIDHSQFKGRTAVVIMSHNYAHDLNFLRAWINSSVTYLGLLGPKLRTTKLLNELTAEGFAIVPERLARTCAPVGLDIGAETPEEIALSIISEVQAVFAGRSSGFLSKLDGPIHREVEHKIVSSSEISKCAP